MQPVFFFTTFNHCSRFLCLTATGAPFKWYCFISEFLNLRHSMALVTAAHMSCSVAHTRASQRGSRRGGGYSGTLSRCTKFSSTMPSMLGPQV